MRDWVSVIEEALKGLKLLGQPRGFRPRHDKEAGEMAKKEGETERAQLALFE